METELKKITPEKYEAMLERITQNGHRITGWYPTMEEAKELASDPIANYEFILWILESNPERELLEEEKQVEVFLNKVQRQYTQFV